MTTQQATREGERRGVAAGVPYLAIPPPEGTERPGLVVILHGLDAPRTEDGMAGALPLDGVPAWRVYLGLPMTGARMPDGGVDEIVRLAGEDALMHVHAPILEQASQELPAAIDVLKKELGIEDAKVVLVGASIGAGAILKSLADTDVRADIVILVNPMARAADAIAAGERAFGTEYRWIDESRQKAAQLDFVRRAGEIASRERPPKVLILQGEDDDPAFVGGSAALHDALRKHYPTVGDLSHVTVPDMGHSLAAEPGIEREPQNAAATYVDETVRGLLARHLV